MGQGIVMILAAVTITGLVALIVGGHIAEKRDDKKYEEKDDE